MLSSPLGVPVLAILIVILPFIFPDADLDGDGYGAKVEAAADCSPLDRQSFPTCQHGAVVACSLTEPGYTPAPEPC